MCTYIDIDYATTNYILHIIYMYIHIYIYIYIYVHLYTQDISPVVIEQMSKRHASLGYRWQAAFLESNRLHCITCYMYISLHVYTSHMYIYIYIYTDHMIMCVSLSLYIYTHIHIYIYIHLFIRSTKPNCRRQVADVTRMGFPDGGFDVVFDKDLCCVRMYIYIYTYTYLSLSLYIYIDIYREREIDR